MNKRLIRVVTLLLVPCLIVDTAIAVGGSPRSTCVSHSVISSETLFRAQAFAPALALDPRHPFSDAGGQKIRKQNAARLAGVQFATPLGKKLQHASEELRQHRDRHRQLRGQYKRLLRQWKYREAASVMKHIEGVSAKMLEAAETVGAYLKEAATFEQRHFKPVLDMLIDRLGENNFPESDREVLAISTVVQNRKDWVERHAPDGRGWVFDLEKIVFVIFVKRLHEILLTRIHAAIVLAMWRFLHFFHDIVSTWRPADRQAFRGTKRTLLRKYANEQGIRAHTIRNSFRTGIAGVAAWPVSGPPTPNRQHLHSAA